MNTAKLEGFVSAIEDESRRPSPSHNNLARLCTMFFHELLLALKELEAKSESVKPTVVAPPEFQASTPPPTEPLTKGHRGRKSTKRVEK